MMAWLFVAVGGALGASMRFALSLAFPYIQGQWPLATFAANMLGCFLMGVLWSLLQQSIISGSLKPLLVTGFLGALTTFSTFSLEAWLMLTHNAYALALSYLLVSIVAGIALVALGNWLAGLVW